MVSTRDGVKTVDNQYDDADENFNCNATDADENVGKKNAHSTKPFPPRSEWPEESRGDQEAEGRRVGGPPEGDDP